MNQLIHSLVAYLPPAVARAIHADPQPLDTPRARSFPAAVLLCDVSGFTALTEKLAATGAAGAEEMTAILNRYFSRMIGILEQEGGEVVQFSGDSLIAVFPTEAELGTAVRRAWQAADQMQTAMTDFATISTSAGDVTLGMKIAIGAGTVIALLVGGALERWQYIIAGDPLRQVAEGEHRARRGEIVLSPAATDLWDAVPLRPCPIAPLDWAGADPIVVSALGAHIPSAISYRLLAGQADWLSELRPMSVLFMGIAGLTINDTAALAAVQRSMTAFQETVYRYEGSINKLLVDDKGAIAIVLFGAPPLAHADDPLRAVLCAADLHRAAAELELTIAIGVTTGQVFAGAVGSPSRREYTVIGDVVNLAARLMQLSGPGITTADHPTYHATRAAIDWLVLTPQPVKGKVASVRVYRPQEPRSQPYVAETADRPFVGRTIETAGLAALLDESAAGATRVAFLIGESGLGKTRLVQAFAGIVRARGLVGLIGSAQAIRRQPAYQGWRAIFESYFGLDGLVNPEERRTQVYSRLAQIAPLDPAGDNAESSTITMASALAERAPLLNDLLELGLPETTLTAGLEPRMRQASLTALLIELLAGWARERPLILVVEDAHWLDSLAWDLAIQVARGLAGLPLLLLITMRPLEQPAPDHPLSLLVNLPSSTLLPLSPLSAADSLALAAAHLDGGELPAPLRALFEQQGGGNPFIIEELAAGLRETGAVRLVAGQLELSNRPDPLRLPDTVQGLVLNRIDRLPVEQQLLIKVAAVIGRVFGYAVLRDVYPSTLADVTLQGALASLSERDLVQPVAEQSAIESHAFRQMIVQEVAYSTVLNVQRRELHGQVAAWFEGHGEVARDLAPLLAYHWRRAGDVDRELAYTRVAAHALAAGYANQESRSYLERALELSDDPALRYEMFWLAEQVCERLGDTAARRQSLDALTALAEQLNDPGLQAQTLNAWAAYHRDTSDYAAAFAALRSALLLAEPVGDRERAARSLTIWGQVLEYQGAFEEARTSFERALATYQAVHDQRGEATNLSSLGNVLSYQGDYRGAQGYYLQSLAIREQIGDRAGEAVSLNNLAQMALYLGETDEAQLYQRRALVLARTIGDRSGEALMLGTLGDIQLALGDYAAARQSFEHAVRLCRAVGERRREASALNQLGMVWRDTGRPVLARACFEEALAIQQAIGDQNQAAYTSLNLGYVLLPDVDAARPHYAHALTLARATGSRDAEAYAYGYSAALESQLGNWDAAEAGYSAALLIWEELEATPPSIECRAGLAWAELARGRLAAARALADACARYLEDHGPDGIEFPLQVYLICYDVLRATGDPQARRMLEAAHGLLTLRATLIRDPQLRADMLASSPESRRVRAEWVDW